MVLIRGFYHAHCRGGWLSCPPRVAHPCVLPQFVYSTNTEVRR